MTAGMTPADRDRLEKCLALAEHGGTAGERAAASAAATRIAAAAGLTLAEAVRLVRRPQAQPSASRPPPRRSYTWAEPRPKVEPITVEELLRQKAETEAWRKRQATAAARRRKQERTEQDAYAAEQRAQQAMRDRDWARARTGTPAADEA